MRTITRLAHLVSIASLVCPFLPPPSSLLGKKFGTCTVFATTTTATATATTAAAAIITIAAATATIAITTATATCCG